MCEVCKTDQKCAHPWAQCMASRGEDCAACGHTALAPRRSPAPYAIDLRFKGHDYVTLLGEWKPPPAVKQVLTPLTAAVGRSVQQVGEVDVGNVRPRPPA